MTYVAIRYVTSDTQTRTTDKKNKKINVNNWNSPPPPKIPVSDNSRDKRLIQVILEIELDPT